MSSNGMYLGSAGRIFATLGQVDLVLCIFSNANVISVNWAMGRVPNK